MRIALTPLVHLLIVLFCFVSHGEGLSQLPTGNGIIRGTAGKSEIVITTTRRLAGAIHSLTWNEKEFIDSHDHGRQLQSASNFDVGTKFVAETFNPTEAGSRKDGIGNTSSSRLLHFISDKNSLQSTSQMAFWLAPDEKSFGSPAKNKKILSNHLLTKRVTIGYQNLPHVISYDVTFHVPIGEFHRYAQFEAVTGYMPPEFNKFWKYDDTTKKLTELSEGPGEQSQPIVFSTENGSHAMGIFSPDQPSKGFANAGYGRFRFKRAKVVKWNCVFRIRNQDAIQPGDYSFRSFVIVGDLQIVLKNMQLLHQMFQEAGS